MARTAIVNSCTKKQQRATNQHKAGVKITKPTRVYNRCKICGKMHGYLRDYGMCRICFRQLASRGEIPGVRKSSW